MPSCCVKGCKSDKYIGSKNFAFFNFPIHDEILLQKWVRQIGTSTLDPLRDLICSRHFLENDLEYNSNKQPPSLKSNAVPTLFSAGASNITDHNRNEYDMIIKTLLPELSSATQKTTAIENEKFTLHNENNCFMIVKNPPLELSSKTMFPPLAEETTAQNKNLCDTIAKISPPEPAPKLPVVSLALKEKTAVQAQNQFAPKLTNVPPQFSPKILTISLDENGETTILDQNPFSTAIDELSPKPSSKVAKDSPVGKAMTTVQDLNQYSTIKNTVALEPTLTTANIGVNENANSHMIQSPFVLVPSQYSFQCQSQIPLLQPGQCTQHFYFQDMQGNIQFMQIEPVNIPQTLQTNIQNSIIDQEIPHKNGRVQVQNFVNISGLSQTNFQNSTKIQETQETHGRKEVHCLQIHAQNPSNHTQMLQTNYQSSSKTPETPQTKDPEHFPQTNAERVNVPQISQTSSQNSGNVQELPQSNIKKHVQADQCSEINAQCTLSLAPIEQKKNENGTIISEVPQIRTLNRIDTSQHSQCEPQNSINVPRDSQSQIQRIATNITEPPKPNAQNTAPSGQLAARESPNSATISRVLEKKLQNSTENLGCPETNAQKPVQSSQYPEPQFQTPTNVPQILEKNVREATTTFDLQKKHDQNQVENIQLSQPDTLENLSRTTVENSKSNETPMNNSPEKSSFHEIPNPRTVEPENSNVHPRKILPKPATAISSKSVSRIFQPEYSGKPDILIVPRRNTDNSFRSEVSNPSRYPGNKRPTLRITINKHYNVHHETTNKSQVGEKENTSNKEMDEDAFEKKITIENTTANKAATFKLDRRTGEIVLETRNIAQTPKEVNSSNSMRIKRKVDAIDRPCSVKLRRLSAKSQQEWSGPRERQQSMRQCPRGKREETPKLRRRSAKLDGKVQKSSSHEDTIVPRLRARDTKTRIVQKSSKYETPKIKLRKKNKSKCDMKKMIEDSSIIGNFNERQLRFRRPTTRQIIGESKFLLRADRVGRGKYGR